MGGFITQIYEIQTPDEARLMVDCGVDHIGSVVLSGADWKQPDILKTRRTVAEAGALSSLILLFNHKETVLSALSYYEPDIVHFCEDLSSSGGRPDTIDTFMPLVHLQAEIRERFSDIRIMRSIPIPQPTAKESSLFLSLARLFEPVSDYFLIDTRKAGVHQQPVSGFVGITGEVCSWSNAAELVNWSPIPVILAGGLSHENVSDAVLAVRPAGVDSCTRTNAVDEDGLPIRFKKDIKRVRRFVAEARRAANRLESKSQKPEFKK